METAPQTGLARVLARSEIVDAQTLAAAWHDRTCVLRLEGAGQGVPADIGGHLRRSFLGALGRGASPEAQASRPCTWEPPCALDVFRREQLRGPKGDGLPKPYLIRAWQRGRDLCVMLRVVGMANDWSMAAVEALTLGIREILPWGRCVRGMSAPPLVAGRSIEIHEIAPDAVPERVALRFLSPVDASGAPIAERPHSLLTRLIRRADAMSRWNGVALSHETGRELARHAAGLDYDLTGLRPGHYQSPNRHGQLRRDPALFGQIVIGGDLAPLWPILQIGARCHIGRHAVEGLGAYRLDPVAGGNDPASWG